MKYLLAYLVNFVVDKIPPVSINLARSHQRQNPKPVFFWFFNSLSSIWNKQSNHLDKNFIEQKQVFMILDCSTKLFFLDSYDLASCLSKKI